jgi:hypothetical protein
MSSGLRLSSDAWEQAAAPCQGTARRRARLGGGGGARTWLNIAADVSSASGKPQYWHMLVMTYGGKLSHKTGKLSRARSSGGSSRP